MDLNQETLRKLLQNIEAYQSQNREGLVTNYLEFTDLKRLVDEKSAQFRAGDDSALWEMVNFYFTHSVKTSHPQYLNQLWAGTSTPALIGEMASAIANTSMYTYEVAPVATLLEKQLLETLKNIVGFGQGEGIFTTGASHGNMMSLMLALHQKYPQIKTKGVKSLPDLAIFVSGEAHYSFDKAVNTLGLGTDCLYKIKTKAVGSMDLADLERQVQTARDQGREPLFVASTAGTTVRGAFDDLEKLKQISHKQGLWLHVDGAWGGSVILSSTHKKLLEGLASVDSFVWDAHKMLGVPLMCSMLFVRTSGLMQRVFDVGDNSYIFHDGAESQDLGRASLQCGRRVDILKWWLEWHFYGHKGLGERVDHFMELAGQAERIIADHRHLELQSPRVINNICFRFNHPDIDDLNDFNTQIRTHLRNSGQSLVNQAFMGPDLTIRLIITNADMTSEDVDTFFAHFLSAAYQLLEDA